MTLTDCIGKLQLELTHITAEKTTKDTHSLLNPTNCGYQSAVVLSNNKKLTSYKVKQAAKVRQEYPWGIVSSSQAIESSNRGRVSNALQEQPLSGTHSLLDKPCEVRIIKYSRHERRGQNNSLATRPRQ
jgi:hypothetical protein